MNSAPNQPITTTTRAAIPIKSRTNNWGMTRISRNKTVSRRCRAVPMNATMTGAAG